MEFYLDTADIDEIRAALDMGLCDGVTTNPSLIARTGRGYMEVLEEICALLGERPVSCECVEREHDAIVAEGRKLNQLADNVVVKVALEREGFRATKTLASEGIRVNNTLCFTANQALLAAKCGAAYISPFVGRLDDVGTDGMELIGQIRTIYDNYGMSTKILVASVRSTMHVLQSAMIGADVATIPAKVFDQLFKHPLTDKGVDAFLADYAKIPKESLQG